MMESRHIWFRTHKQVEQYLRDHLTRDARFRLRACDSYDEGGPAMKTFLVPRFAGSTRMMDTNDGESLAPRTRCC